MLNILRYLNIISHLKTEIEILALVKLTEALRIFIRVKKEALNRLANVNVLPVFQFRCYIFAEQSMN